MGLLHQYTEKSIKKYTEKIEEIEQKNCPNSDKHYFSEIKRMAEMEKEGLKKVKNIKSFISEEKELFKPMSSLIQGGEIKTGMTINEIFEKAVEIYTKKSQQKYPNRKKIEELLVELKELNKK